MKYPILKGKFATMAEAANLRDQLNGNRRRGKADVTSVVRRGKTAWEVYDLLVNAPQQKQTAKPRHDESQLQRSCVEWFRLKYRSNARLLFAVPNGGRRNPREASIMKAEGVTAGVADLLLFMPRQGYHALCIEMKTATGRQSPEQRSWQELVECNGYKYQVVRSFDEFRETIEEYVEGPTKYAK